MRLPLERVEDLARGVLTACGASALQAGPVARSIRDAEADGLPNIGLSYLPLYCDHLRSGKVDGQARPVVERLAAAAIRVDAATGFAHAAFVAGETTLVEAAGDVGTAGVAVVNSYASGVLGWFAERIAAHGLVAIAFTNASAMIAPWGGKVPVFGTNPIAFAVPREGRPPLVIDQASSTTARINVYRAGQRGERIPADWLLDRDGLPTTDPADLATGSMAPAGGYKGAAMALLVEIMAGGLAGPNWSFEAASVVDEDGRGPPRIGQFVLAIDPARFGAHDFTARIERLVTAMLEQDGVRLPGDRRIAARARAEADGVEVDPALIERLERYGSG